MRSRTNQMRRVAERGSVTAVTALGMLAFLLAVGLCVDISHFYVARAELQNGADAAALAGATALNSEPSGITEATNRAVTVMNNYEFDNEGVTIGPENVLFAVNFNGPYMDADSAAAEAADIRFIQVQVPPKPIKAVFAGIAMNQDTELEGTPGNSVKSADISAEATAGMSMPPNVICEWIPLAVLENPDAPLAPGSTYTIRGDPHSSASPGNYQVLAVQGRGSEVARTDLGKNINQCASPGDEYSKDTEPGINAGPVRQGLNSRFDIYVAGMDWQEFPPDTNIKQGITFDEYKNATPGSTNWESPSAGHVGVPNRRIVIIPLVSASEFSEGRDTVRFRRFAAFFLQTTVDGGSGGDVVAEYIGERIIFGGGGYVPGAGPVVPELAMPVLYR